MKTMFSFGIKFSYVLLIGLFTALLFRSHQNNKDLITYSQELQQDLITLQLDHHYLKQTLEKDVLVSLDYLMKHRYIGDDTYLIEIHLPPVKTNVSLQKKKSLMKASLRNWFFKQTDR